MGLKCDQCKDGYYNLGSSSEFGCVSCGCNTAGTLEQSEICDKVIGACKCKSNVEGRECNVCKGQTFNLTMENPDGCAICDCDITGTDGGAQGDASILSCDQNTGQCTCLAQRMGRRCGGCNNSKSCFFLVPNGS